MIIRLPRTWLLKNVVSRSLICAEQGAAPCSRAPSLTAAPRWPAARSPSAPVSQSCLSGPPGARPRFLLNRSRRHATAIASTEAEGHPERLLLRRPRCGPLLHRHQLTQRRLLSRRVLRRSLSGRSLGLSGSRAQGGVDRDRAMLALLSPQLREARWIAAEEKLQARGSTSQLRRRGRRRPQIGALLLLGGRRRRRRFRRRRSIDHESLRRPADRAGSRRRRLGRSGRKRSLRQLRLGITLRRGRRLGL